MCAQRKAVGFVEPLNRLRRPAIVEDNTVLIGREGRGVSVISGTYFAAGPGNPSFIISITRNTGGGGEKMREKFCPGNGLNVARRPASATGGKNDDLVGNTSLYLHYTRSGIIGQIIFPSLRR